MASISIAGDTSGQVTIAAPAVAGANTITLPAATGTVQLIGTGTVVATTSGTAVDFTNIPAGTKRITVMFSGMSVASGGNDFLVQLGTGSTPTFTTSGYAGSSASTNNSGANSTAGFIVVSPAAAGADTISGTLSIVLLDSATFKWVSSHSMTREGTTFGIAGGGRVTLSAVLTAVRITTSAGAAFDAGQVNILYEG